MFLSSGDWKETVYYVSKEFVRVVNSSGTFDTTYVYHEGQLVAEREDDGTKLNYFYIFFCFLNF